MQCFERVVKFPNREEAFSKFEGLKLQDLRFEKIVGHDHAGGDGRRTWDNNGRAVGTIMDEGLGTAMDGGLGTTLTGELPDKRRKSITKSSGNHISKPTPS